MLARLVDAMAKLIRPGRLVRATLTLLGVLFLPLGIWFARDPKHRYLTESIALIVIAVVCFYYGFRRDTKLMELLEGLDS
jgi:uncharacterized membrane protein